MVQTPKTFVLSVIKTFEICVDLHTLIDKICHYLTKYCETLFGVKVKILTQNIIKYANNNNK